MNAENLINELSYYYTNLKKIERWLARKYLQITLLFLDVFVFIESSRFFGW